MKIPVGEHRLELIGLKSIESSATAYGKTVTREDVYYEYRVCSGPLINEKVYIPVGGTIRSSKDLSQGGKQ